jgi:hypothetical protein
MSYTENCVLVDAFTGRDIVRLTRLEADSMVAAGKAVRIGGQRRTGRHRYRQVLPVAPSNSSESMPMLTVSDTRAVAGLCIPTVDQAERLEGWGFHVPKASCDACEGLVRMPHFACV